MSNALQESFADIFATRDKLYQQLGLGGISRHLDSDTAYTTLDHQDTLTLKEVREGIGSTLRAHPCYTTLVHLLRYLDSTVFIDTLTDRAYDQIENYWKPLVNPNLTVRKHALAGDIEEALQENSGEDSSVQCNGNSIQFSYNIGRIDNKWTLYCQFTITKQGRVQDFEIGDFK